MASESGGSAERRWLMGPPGPQQIAFGISSGDQVDVTPETRQAFNQLLEAMAAADVAGYTADDCTHYVKGCDANTFDCTPRSICTAEAQYPCLMDYTCAVAPTRR